MILEEGKLYRLRTEWEFFDKGRPIVDRGTLVLILKCEDTNDKRSLQITCFVGDKLLVVSRGIARYRVNEWFEEV